jgi:hypothetical protein
LLAVPGADKQLDANVDHGNVTGHFMRVDVTLHRVPELDREGLSGYGIVDTEDNVTLRFGAQRIEL